jgi:hypothetical protein
MGSRADSLADRIEEGAAGLAAFAEGLSNAEWRTPMSVTDVTWEAVADMNAKHASDQAGVTKAAALDLLRRNSRQAAAAVRAFTDDELDRAAPFSLSFAAPVTAQFVVEDHAVRHSWHHLARIRAALRR